AGCRKSARVPLPPPPDPPHQGGREREARFASRNKAVPRHFPLASVHLMASPPWNAAPRWSKSYRTVRPCPEAHRERACPTRGGVARALSRSEEGREAEVAALPARFRFTLRQLPVPGRALVARGLG